MTVLDYIIEEKEEVQKAIHRKIDILSNTLCFENSKVLIVNMKDRCYNYLCEKRTIWRDKSEERTCQKIR